LDKVSERITEIISEFEKTEQLLRKLEDRKGDLVELIIWKRDGGKVSIMIF
jgi:hypothetical protein